MDKKVLFGGICFVFTLLLSACSSGNMAKEQDFLLSAKAVGSSEEDARNKALSNLSQQIFVSVSSALNSSETLKNQDFNITVQNDVLLTSLGYFQGVTFYNTKKITKNSYEMSVGITLNAYKETVAYLNGQIDQLAIAKKDKFLLREDLNKLDFLLALISYAKGNGIVLDVDREALLAYRKQLADAVDSSVRLKFLVNLNDANIKIVLNNKTYKPFDNIYLAEGKYSYEVQLDGYKTKKGNLSLKKGDNKQVNIYMQKQLASPFLVTLDVECEVNCKYVEKVVQNILYDNQMKISNNANAKVVFRFSKPATKSLLDNFYITDVAVTIEIYKGGALEKNHNFIISYVNKNSKVEIPAAVIEAQIKEKTEEFLAGIYE